MVIMEGVSLSINKPYVNVSIQQRLLHKIQWPICLNYYSYIIIYIDRYRKKKKEKKLIFLDKKKNMIVVNMIFFYMNMSGVIIHVRNIMQKYQFSICT